MLSDNSPQDTLAATRRGVLRSLGLGALALVGSSTPASAFIFRSSNNAKVVRAASPKVDLDGLPADWVARQGTTLREYAEFLRGLRLQRLQPRQVIEAHAKRKGSVWNSLPPRAMWKQMAPTLKVVDRVCLELDQPVKEVISAYRSPAYNARCAGASRGSWHQANVAVDVQLPVRPSVVVQTARGLRSRGVFRGGIGRYSTFTHIDTRGQNVDW